MSVVFDKKSQQITKSEGSSCGDYDRLYTMYW